MSYRQLLECRELEKLAQELNFVLHPGQGEILVRCREVLPEDDPTGQTIVPHSAWEPFSTQASIMYGNVSEVLSFLQGVKFMKTYVETHLGLKKQVQNVQEKHKKNLQHNTTIRAITK